jgi:hypothetical protein
MVSEKCIVSEGRESWLEETVMIEAASRDDLCEQGREDFPSGFVYLVTQAAPTRIQRAQSTVTLVLWGQRCFRLRHRSQASRLAVEMYDM